MPWYDQTLTDRSITSATGASQTLCPTANPNRRSLLIKNGASNTSVNLLGVTASIGAAGTVTLVPYEGLYLSGDDCPKGVINVITVSAAYVTAFEGA